MAFGCSARKPALGIAQNQAKSTREHRVHIILHAPFGGGVGLAPGGLSFKNARHQTAKVGAERNAATTNAEAKHDAPARKRAAISGSGDDAG